MHHLNASQLILSTRLQKSNPESLLTLQEHGNLSAETRRMPTKPIVEEAKSLPRQTLLQLPMTPPQKYAPPCHQSCWYGPPSLCTWGRQSGRDSKMTSRTPMGTVTCSSSRSFAIRVLRMMRPTLSWEDAAIWRSPMARLFSFAADRLSRFNRGSASLPGGKQEIRLRPIHPLRLQQR